MSPRQSSPRRKPRGFTLLELVIAVVILVVISAVALPVYNSLRTNSQLSAEASQLANVNKEALSIATANGRAVPTAADITAAINDTPTFGAAAGLAATSSVTVSTSTSGSVVASTSSNVISADVSTSSVGLALNSPAGGCVMSLLSGSTITSWWYSTALGYNCNGTQALAGKNQPALTYSAGPAPIAPGAPSLYWQAGQAPYAYYTDGNGTGYLYLRMQWNAASTNGGTAISSYTITYTDTTLGKAATSTCAAGAYYVAGSVPTNGTQVATPTIPSTIPCSTNGSTTSFNLYPNYFSGTQTGWPDCNVGYTGNYNAFYNDSVTFTVTATNTAGVSTTSAPLTVTISKYGYGGGGLGC